MNKGRRGTTPLAQGKRRAPYQQGDLDGLCGVYAIINAVRFLCPELRQRDAAALFRVLMRTLARDGPRAVYMGLGRRRLERLLQVACDQIKGTGIILEVAPLRDLGGRKRMIWARLQKELDGRSVLILGLSGRCEHWTAAYRATAKTLQLLDSGGMAFVRRACCTVRPTRKRYRIGPRSVLRVSRPDKGINSPAAKLSGQSPVPP